MPIPTEMFDFLADLAEHNDRDWFTANKKRYEAAVKDPALAFIRDFAAPLKAISPHYLAVPKAVGGSLFRIYRDTRFSADKTPYKTQTGMQFRHAQASSDVHAPGFYLHIEPGGSGAGIGVWMAPNPALQRIREKIVAEPERWATMKADLATAGLAFMERGDKLKRVPRGFDADHAHAEDLKRKSIAVWRAFTDAEVTADGFGDQLARTYADGAPLVAFLCEALGLEF